MAALLAALLIAGLVGGLAVWLRSGHVPADEAEPTSASTTATLPAALDASEAPAPTLPVPDDASPVESLAPPLDDQSIRGSSRVLEWWGSRYEGGARAPCTLLVIDWEDKPVPGALVHVWGDETETSSAGHQAALAPRPIGPFDSTTDSDGRCTVQPPEFRPRVQVEKTGVGSSRWLELAGSRDDQYRVRLVPLCPDARIVGRVVSAEGQPVAAAAVHIDVGRSMAPAEEVLTQPDGTFEIAVTPFERVGVRLHLDDTETRWHRLTLQPGETKEVLLRQPGSFAIRGVLLDRSGMPHSSVPAWVSFWPDADVLSDAEGFPVLQVRPELKVRIGDDGRFELLLDRPARGMITARGATFGGLVETPHVAIDVQQPRADVVLRIAEPASISGRVLDGGGSPLAGVAVLATPDRKPWTSIDATWGLRESDLYASWTQTTSEDGGFHFMDLHPEPSYTISVDDQSGPAPLMSVRGVSPGTNDLVLGPDTPAARTGSIVVAVTAGDTGERVGEFQVTLWERSPDGGWVNKRSQSSKTESGLTVVDRLTTGATYDLLLEAGGLACAGVGGIVATEEGTAVKLTLSAPATLSIDVTHAGHPALWPVVVAEREWGADELLFHRHAARGARGTELGRVELRDLEPGRYALRVTQGGRGVSAELDLASGESRSMSIDLP